MILLFNNKIKIASALPNREAIDQSGASTIV